MEKQEAEQWMLVFSRSQVSCNVCIYLWRSLVEETSPWFRRRTNYARIIRCDNQSMIKPANNQVFHKNTKHIDMHFHFVREKVQSKEFYIEYCNTYDNVAYIFTKPPGRIEFKLSREMLGILVNPFSIKGEFSNFTLLERRLSQRSFIFNIVILVIML